MDFFSNFIYLVFIGALDVRNFNGFAVVARETYVKNTDNDLLAEVAPNLMTAVGYGEQAITGYSLVHNRAEQQVEMNFSIPSFGSPAVGQTGSAVLIYHKGTVDGQVNPLAMVLEGTNRSTTGGPFSVALPAGAPGIVRATRAASAPIAVI